MPAWLLPAAVGAAGLVGSLFSARAAAREAEKNRDFQERMSDTAHQREVKDLWTAGLNPALSAMRGSGASSPSGAVAHVPDFGDSIGRGVASALAVRQQQAQIKLLEAQANLTETQAADITATQPGRVTLTQMQGMLAEANWSQVRALMPELIDKARQEVMLTAASARRAHAAAALDEYAKTGAINLMEFEKSLGERGPWLKLFLQAAKAVK